MKKLLALLMAAVLLLTMAGCGGEAAPTEPTQNPETQASTEPAQPPVALSGTGTQEDPWCIGSPEEGAVTMFVSEDLLVIEGEGAMMDFREEDVLPWSEQAVNVTTFFWSDDVTNVGSFAFRELGKADSCSIFLPASLQKIGEGAFMGASIAPGVMLPEGLETISSRAFAQAVMGDVYLEGHPDVADDAFAGGSAEIRGSQLNGWSQEAPAFCGGDVVWVLNYTFSYELVYDTDEISGSGALHLPSNAAYTFDAVMENSEEGYHFSHYELVDGSLDLGDGTNPVLELMLTGDAAVRIYYEHD